MNNKIFTDIAQNRARIVSRFKDETDYPTLIKTAQQRWIDYEPTTEKNVIIAVDGGRGFKQYQGLNAYVIDSIAMGSSGRPMQGIVGKDRTGLYWEYDVAPINIQHVLNRMLKLEVRMITELLEFDFPDGTYPIPDLILQDGALSSWFSSGAFTTEFHETKIDIAKFLVALKNHLSNQPIDPSNSKKVLVFVSKTSDSTKYFEDLHIENRAGDIYYFNHMGHRRPGYSLPLEYQPGEKITQFPDLLRKANINIIIFYARLRNNTPIFKFELANARGFPLNSDEMNNLRQKTIPELLNRLAYHSVAGYPYRLVQAHLNASITDNDMRRVIQLFRLQNEIGSREALGE